MCISGCALPPLVAHSSFPTTLLNRSNLSSSSGLSSSSSVIRSFPAGVAADLVSGSPNSSIASRRCGYISTCTVPSPGRYIFMPRNVCRGPRVTAIFPNLPSIASMTYALASGLTCVMTLSSTHHPIMHCFLLIILYATHGSYWLILKPIPTNVSLKSLYHSIADLKHPYKALSSRISRVFFPFS